MGRELEVVSAGAVATERSENTSQLGHVICPIYDTRAHTQNVTCFRIAWHVVCNSKLCDTNILPVERETAVRHDWRA